MIAAGNFLLAACTNLVWIIEITQEGKIVRDHSGEGEGRLNCLPLAIELPNGNIRSNDDLKHRVMYRKDATA